MKKQLTIPTYAGLEYSFNTKLLRRVIPFEENHVSKRQIVMFLNFFEFSHYVSDLYLQRFS